MKLAHPPDTLRPIDAAALDEAAAAAAVAPRGRVVRRYHEHDEPVQRMLNAIEPGSYVRPHRHQDPAKVEAFVALRGAALLLRFHDDGALAEAVALRAGGPVHGAEVPPGVWHSLVALEPGTVLYEVLEGPYLAATHKDFAPWAPPEGSSDGPRWLATVLEGR